MELKDSFVKLELLRIELGAGKRMDTFDQPLDSFQEIEDQLGTVEGIEVNKDDIRPVGPFITYQGEHLAILYILNSTAPSEAILSEDPEARAPKFHFTWCRTLKEMNQKGRFDRYVLSRSKKNRFRVEALERDPEQIDKLGERHVIEDVRLFPCQNCLSELAYRGFAFHQSKAERLKQVKDFSIEEYLEENDGNLAVMKHLPETTAERAKAGDYTKDFPEISRKLREEASWKCSECHVDMTQKKAGLHVHHINGVKYDNSRSNLRVLCALCHQAIDEFHKTMHVTLAIQNFIRRARGGPD